jgi:hypothetical protein
MRRDKIVDAFDKSKWINVPIVEKNKKQEALSIYNKLIGDDELMHELNVLLRNRKIEKFKK